MAARPQQPRRLGDPAVGIGPDARAVLGDRQVEGGVGKRNVLCGAPRRAGTRARARPACAARSRAGRASGRRRPRARRGGRATRTCRPCRSRARRRPCRRRPGALPARPRRRPRRPRRSDRWPSFARPTRRSRPPSVVHSARLRSTESELTACAASRSAPSASGGPTRSPPPSGTSRRRRPAAAPRRGPRSGSRWRGRARSTCPAGRLNSTGSPGSGHSIRCRSKRSRLNSGTVVSPSLS